MSVCVSIIVPVYNIEQYLPRCISSLCNQTLRNIENLLVDDGSTDSSGIICDKYSEADGRIQVFHQTNRGVSAARNKGISGARGKYVGFVDGDDWVELDMYEVLYKDA